MRAVALFLVVVIAGSSGFPLVSPLASAVGETCPMHADRTNDETCIGAACPCEHESMLSLSVAPMPAVLGSEAASMLMAARPAARPRSAPCISGFPTSIDHPPDARA